MYGKEYIEWLDEPVTMSNAPSGTTWRWSGREWVCIIPQGKQMCLIVPQDVAELHAAVSGYVH